VSNCRQFIPASCKKEGLLFVCSTTGVGGPKQARWDRQVLDAKSKHQKTVDNIERYTTAWRVQPCCKNKCCNNFTPPELLQIELTHQYNLNTNEYNYNSWLQEQLRHSFAIMTDSVTGMTSTSRSTFKIVGREVCPSVFKTIYHVGNVPYNTCRKLVIAGIAVSSRPKNNGAFRSTIQTRGSNILHEFQDRMAAMSEVMPNSLAEDNDGIQEIRAQTELSDSQMDHYERRMFPCCFTWMSLWTEYVNETAVRYSHLQDEIGTFSYNHFRKSFKARYPNIAFLGKDSTAFKCKICSELRTKLNGATREGDRLIIESYIHKHAKHFRRARDHYATTITRCILNFKYFKELSCVIDGMDQNKCLFPRVMNRYDLSHEDQIKFHLIGALIHGLGFQGHLMQGKKWTRCSSDTCITVLVKTISWVMITTQQTKLPEILHLQLDNCVKENKCNEFMSFLHYLVYIGAFKEIYVNYCVVGHTHIDIDQVFSRLSARLRRGHLTLTEFIGGMQDSYTYLGRKAEIERLEHVAHWGHAIEGFMVDKLNGITEPLCFRFQRETDERTSPVYVSYKSHCEKKEWKGNLRLIADCVPLPWDTCEQTSKFEVLDVTGIRDGTGDEIMSRFENKIVQHVPEERKADVRSEWQSFADSETEWAKELCRDCSIHRSDVRLVSGLFVVICLFYFACV
jgi:hypothetical protein